MNALEWTLVSILLVTGITVGALVATGIISHKKASTKLGVITIAKNESMVIREFLKHYQRQGVDHVHLINNGSTDDMVDIVKKEFQHFVSVWELHEPAKQVEHYNTVYEKVRHGYEWMAVVDVDEYMFGVQEPLKDYVMKQDKLDYISVEWTMFGSSGHVTQPDSVVEGFIHRAEGKKDENVKSVFRTSHVYELIMHDHKRVSKTRSREHVKPDDPEIRLHHYPIMSWEYFKTVKMTRGDADRKSSNIRNRHYFDSYDAPCTIKDTTLSDLPYLQQQEQPVMHSQHLQEHTPQTPIDPPELDPFAEIESLE